MVGISTRAMMLRLMIPPGSFILHLGAMYKMNQYDYPVLVVGGSDRSRRFHLVALFVISQETQPVVQAALLVLRRQFYWITHKHLLLRYAMDDCDQAECNALAAVFGDNPSYRFLMCFFHVVKKVQVAIKPFSSGAAATVLREVYDLHFVRSLVSYLEMLRAVLKLWLGEPGACDVPLTAVSTPSGMLWEWLVMPQGLSNAPATFNRLVTQLFRPHQAYAQTYFDDIVVHSRAEHGKSDVESHVGHLRAVLECMHISKLNGNLDKCVFGAEEIPFLGYFIGKRDLRADPATVKAIVEWPVPKNQKDLR
ncbi:hypothetical protein PC110_g19440, partial [Phytophthora cactorum]